MGNLGIDAPRQAADQTRVDNAWLTVTGRRSGQPRRVVVGYVEDGDNLVTMAMNGWGAAEPAVIVFEPADSAPSMRERRSSRAPDGTAR